MEKITTSITLEPQVKEETMKILKSQDKKLSTVINSMLKKYIENSDKSAINQNLVEV